MTFWPVSVGGEPVAERPTRPAGSGWPIPATAAVTAAAAGIAVAASASPWLRAYQIGGARAFLWSAAGASVLLSTATTRVARQRPAVAYAASLLGLALVSLALTGPHPGQFWHGLTHGPGFLLSETLPLEGSRALLAAPLVVTWVCGVATSELLWRVRPAPVGLVVPVLGFVASYAVVSSAPGDDGVAAPVLLLVLAVAAVAAHHQADLDSVAVDVPSVQGDTPRRHELACVLTVVAVAGLAAVLGVAVPELPGVDTNPDMVTRAPPSASATLVNPVAAIATLRNQSATRPAQTLLNVATGGPSTGYLGVATLDNYDGGSWTFDTTFRPTGGRVPAVPPGAPGYAPTSGGSSRLVQRYSLQRAYPLWLLPMADRPAEVRGFGADADPETGMVVPAREIRVPLSYQVTSLAPIGRLDTVPKADGIGVVAGQRPDAGALRDLALPAGSSGDIATAVRYVASLTGERPAPTVAFLQSALAVLRANGFDDVPNPRANQPGESVPAPSVGTGLAEVINATTVTRMATPEQWATMFAMVARYVGVPARVVTGFRIAGPGGGASLVPAGAHTITGKEAWTWVEIPVAGIGWVVADPTPSATSAGSPPTPAAGSSTAVTPQNRQANAVPRNEITGHAVAPRVHIPLRRPAGGGLPSWVWALVAVGGLLLLAALIPAGAGLRRWFRRRARHSTDPDELAVGAWLELLDGLERAGLRPHGSATTAQIVAEAGHSFGEDVVPGVAAVGAVADRAVFASRSVEPNAAERAWQLQAAARRDVLRRLDRRRLAKAAVTVGHHPRRPRRQ